MVKYDVVAENVQGTVVSEYNAGTPSATRYQSEAALESAFIKQLQAQNYKYVNIRSESEMIANLRHQLEQLNKYTFTDAEWERFFTKNIANPSNGIREKTRILQEDHIQLLTRDDGTVKNIYLIDKINIHNNTLQVIKQYATDAGVRDNRYDVTLLVNGIPMVHVELKRRGVDIKEAFNQINRYQRDSFWAGSGLYEYIQIFVISNGTYTKYYSNTTRVSHINENSNRGPRSGKRASNSFEFTSWWADANNTPITDLMDFAKTFLARHTILNILTKYCVFNADQMLLVMRPYQIVATERIINKIKIAYNYKKWGTIDAGGYIWHTTGSGKTLTSFKTAQLASAMPEIDKVLFVVDRKDLDYQTMLEYDRFQKGAANSNTSTTILEKQLRPGSDARIIITTIQKLSSFIKKYREHPVFDQQVVLIFDECHRSQFGEMHSAIIKAFKKYYLFGFTGTPIFAANAQSGGKPDLKTTEQIFGQKLHTYTIVDAIRDKNVLPFKIDYVSTLRVAEDIDDKQVNDIDRESILMAPERIQRITKYILEHFDQKTMRNTFYQLKERRLAGFNSMLAVSSINAAKLYYSEFKRQMATLPSDKRLKVATIYSFGVNDDDGIIDENSDDTSGLDASSRDFLDMAIADYNAMFGTNFDTSAAKFSNYYKDLSRRIKDREVDLTIVVNMFLTGFDAKTLNTLWVDKNLRQHGLLQAFSRTNRILNSVKTHGNIVCFRNLERATNECIALFGDKDAAGLVLLKPYNEYYYGYEKNGAHVSGYSDLISELTDKYQIGTVLASETAKKDFVRLYGAILRVKNILVSFDEFVGNEILSPRQFQDYQSMYIALYNEMRPARGSVENVNDDLVFEMELIKSVDVNIDYILTLISRYHASHMTDKEILITINKTIDSSIELRSKKDLILQFIASLTPDSVVERDWVAFINSAKIAELDQIIADEHLNREETYNFVQNAFRDGYVQTNGMDIGKILPPMSMFDRNNNRAKKKKTVIEKIIAFFERFFSISE